MLLQENLQPIRNYINDYDYMSKELLKQTTYLQTPITISRK